MSEYIVDVNDSSEMYAVEMGRYEELREVIRCRDCKWAVKCYGDVVMVDEYGEEIHEPLGMNGYCSMAERKDDETS